MKVITFYIDDTGSDTDNTTITVVDPMTDKVDSVTFPSNPKPRKNPWKFTEAGDHDNDDVDGCRKVGGYCFKVP